MRAIASIVLAIVLVNGAHAQSHANTVPFVGCRADGQQGYVPPPKGQAKVVPAADIPLQGIAYYKGDDASGVFAPAGWRCRAWYGSSGGSLLVTAGPIDTTHFMPPKVLGPAVEMIGLSAGTSGRYSVARFASRLFPGVLASLIAATKDLGIVPDSEFDPRHYARDSVRSLGRLGAEFTTPRGVNGLGTEGDLGPSQHPIHGVAVIAPDSAEPDMTILRVRLGASMRVLEATVLRLNGECMQKADGC